MVSGADIDWCSNIMAFQFVDRSNSLVRESITLKMRFATGYQLRKGQFRSWLKLRQHERLENEDSYAEETSTNPEGNQSKIV